MDNHPIENLMKNTMENIKDMIDVNTIVGDALNTPDGTTIVPISRVSFGFASGGSEFSSDKQNENDSNYPFGGGSGAGVTVKPVAFLVIKKDQIRLLSVDHRNNYDKLLDNVPQIIDMIKDNFSSNENNKESKDDESNLDCDCDFNATDF